MVRRPRGAAFMADAFVFPGGSVDEGDKLPSSDACCIAAIRELFEEAGVLLAVDQSRAPVRTDGDAWFDEARRAIKEGKRTFRELLDERGLALAVDELAFFARWITPSSEPRRFDARFFLARMPPGQTARFDETELKEQRWATPRALLDDHARGGIKLPPPTLWHLRDLSRRASIDEALAWARARTVEPVRPKLVPADGTLAIVLPWDPEYPSLPGEGAVIDRAHEVAGATDRFLLVDGRWQPSPAGSF